MTSYSDQESPELSRNMEDEYGEIKIFRFNYDREFWTLCDYMFSIECRFRRIEYLQCILDAFSRGELYGLAADIGANQLWEQDPAFIVGGGLGMLKCFCVVDDNRCEIIWVDPSLRRKGLGTTFVKQLDITSPPCFIVKTLSESLPFWDSVGVDYSY